jgi:hypothetical protein
VLVLVATAMLPETRGRELETTVEERAGLRAAITRSVADPA